MKWLFAAAAAVCLFACGGPQDEAGLEKQARPDKLATINATSGEYCSNGGSQPRAQLSPFNNPADPTDFRNGHGVVGTFTHSIYGGCLGPVRSVNCGCRLVGDKIFDLDASGNQLYQAEIFSSCSGKPPLVPASLVAKSTDGFQDQNTDTWYPVNSPNAVGFCQF